MGKTKEELKHGSDVSEFVIKKIEAELIIH